MLRLRSPLAATLLATDNPPVTDNVWREAVGAQYQGPIVVGRDGTEIKLDD